MAATTTLLGLVTPTQGSLPGVWGDTVNYGITDYVDIAIAGTLAFAGDGAITLANTTGSSSGNSIGATTAQYAIIRVTGTLTTAKIITGPSYSKTYLVVNAATGSTVTFKASGQTGVSIAVGETALVYYNGTDYVKVVGTATAGAAGGSTTQVQYNNAGVLAGITGATTNGTALTLVAPNLGSPASVGTMPAFTLGGTVSGGGNQINNVIIGTSTPLAGAFTTLTASSTATLNTLVSSGATLTGGTINGMTVGATTASTGAFTTLSATGDTNLVTTTVIGGAGTAAGLTALTVGDATNATFRMAFTNGPLIQVATNNTVTMAFGAKESASGAFTQWAALSSTGLAVTGALSATGTLSGGTSGTAYSFSGSAPATSLTLDSSGNLGVGVAPSAWASANPIKAIQVGRSGSISYDNGTASTNIVAGAYLSATGQWTKIGTTGAAKLTLSDYDGSFFWSRAASGSGNFTYTDVMVLDASGNLGIGETSPAFPLDVKKDGNSSVTVAHFDNPNAGSAAGVLLSFGNDASNEAGRIGYFSSTHGVFPNTLFLTNDLAGPIVFRTNGTERMRLDSSGALLIGVTTSSTTVFQEIKYTTAAAGTRYINTSSSASTVMDFVAASSQVGSITTSGSATLYNVTSDYRLKTVTGAVTGHGARIDALQPIEYTWNSNGSSTRGFLAHQFQEVYASSVTGTKDAVDADGKPKYQAMQASTSEVIADLVAELQSLRARVAQLESKL